METEFDDETLVAFLDGELAAEQAQQIEASLSQQPTLRERLTKLRQTWDLLDELPIILPSQQFAASTMEMIALTPEETPATWLGWLSKNSSLLILLSVPTLFLVGFAAAKYGQSRIDRHLLRDLPLLVDWKSLSNIDSVEWLEVLSEEPYLTETMPPKPTSLVGGGEVPAAMSERRQWLAQLSDVDRSRMSSNRNELQQRDLERQTQLREIVGHIYANPEKTAVYLAAIRSYELLLQDQSLTLRASLNDMSPAQRERELLHLVSWRLAVNYGRRLSIQDTAAIVAWAEEMQKQYINWIGAFSDATVSVYRDLLFSGPDSVINENDFNNLVERLSPSAQAILDGLNDGEARTNALIVWIGSLAGPSESDAETPDTEKLKQLYMALPSTKKDAIDLLPPDEAQRKIRALSNAPTQIKG